MDSYTFMLTDTELEEVVSREVNFLTRVVSFIRNRRRANRPQETSYIEILDEVTSHSSIFRDNIHCTEKEGISPLLKCTSAIRQLADGVVHDFLDEYLEISERTSSLSLDHFCTHVMEIFMPEYLRKPMVTDVVKLYRHHEEKHGFPGML
ncbi:hypothetical protein Tco_0422014 [Tanacetum coccineum]